MSVRKRVSSEWDKAVCPSLSLHVRESGSGIREFLASKIWNPGIFFGGFRNSVLYAESHKWLECGIPSSTGRESGITQPFPQGFSLKKWKSPGDEVGNYLEPANLESMEWNPESRIQHFSSWIITMISPRLHFFFVYANSQITDICND